MAALKGPLIGQADLPRLAFSEVDFRKGLRHVAPLSSVTIRSNGPFRSDVCWCTYAPGLWPGLAETAFQAENLVEILLVRSNKKWRCPINLQLLIVNCQLSIFQQPRTRERG